MRLFRRKRSETQTASTAEVDDFLRAEYSTLVSLYIHTEDTLYSTSNSEYGVVAEGKREG